MCASRWCLLTAVVVMSVAASDECPDTWMPLPSDLPQQLHDSLRKGLRELILATVNVSSSTNDPSGGEPTCAAMELHYGDRILASAFVGQRDPKAHDGPPDEKTIFRIGSVTKLFPVLMLYQLYDRGLVQSLDDPISKYAPGFLMINAYSNSKWQFTLRQLASQLSGLPREAPCPLFDCNISTSEILQRWSSTPGAIWPEDTEPSYSNFAYSLLGHVLASMVGMSFPEYVQQHILDPLGMMSTGFVLPNDALRFKAVAYANETQIPWYDIGWNAPAGQMYSTVRDLAKLCYFFQGFSGEHILDGGLRRELLLPEFLFRDGTFLTGSPWEIQFFTDSRWLMLGKGGNLPGYSASINIIPNLNLSMVILWNGMISSSDVSSELFNKLLPEFMAALGPHQPPAALPESPLQYLGTYHADLPVTGVREYNISNATLPNGSWALVLVMSRRTSMWLDFKSKSQAVMRRVRRGQTVSCMGKMLSATEREWVTFTFDEDGSVSSLELPGLAYGYPFRHTKVEVQDGHADRRLSTLSDIHDIDLFV